MPSVKWIARQPGNLHQDYPLIQASGFHKPQVFKEPKKQRPLDLEVSDVGVKLYGCYGISILAVFLEPRVGYNLYVWMNASTISGSK